MRRLMREVRKAGCEVETTGGNHYKVKCPRGIVICSVSPSDWRAVRKAAGDLRRAGVEVR
jgi:hypothetical protein